MITFLVLILILSILVLIHEFGHFYVARRNNVRVEEFGWGIPPRLWGKQIGETIYSINWLPFGGFVKLTGEDFDEQSVNTQPDPRSFRSKKPLQRLAILVAGVFMNILLAGLIYSLMFFITSYKSMTIPMFFDYSFQFGRVDRINTVIGGFGEGSTAASAGIQFGEAIIEVDGIPVYSSDDIRKVLADKDGKEVSILLMDVRKLDRPTRSISLKVSANSEGKVLLGVMLTPAFRLDYSDSILGKVTAGFAHTYNMAGYSFHTLGSLISLSIESRDVSPVSESVSGPVGVSRAISSILSYSGIEVFIGLLDLTALLSVSLAVMNILPFPALDGGRALFVIIEMVKGKKISERFEGIVHQWGMLFLLALLILITIKDVKSFF